MNPPRLIAVLLVLAVAGCGIGVGGGSGGDAGDQVGAGDGLISDVAGTQAPWLVLDLATGRVEGRTTSPAIAEAGLRDRYLAFRRIEAGTARLGSGALARQDDEVVRKASHGAYYIAVCELTRAQWRRLAGSEPWLDQPAVAGGGDELPALGISVDAARAMLAAVHLADGARLRLPGAVEWEVAARAGSAASFPWGEGDTAGVAGRYAVSAETGSAPAPVASLAPNAFGLYDLCGNAWELTSDGAIRGGSWEDALVLARPANRAAIEPDTRHEAVGLRLVYVP